MGQSVHCWPALLPSSLSSTILHPLFITTGCIAGKGLRSLRFGFYIQAKVKRQKFLAWSWAHLDVMTTYITLNHFISVLTRDAKWCKPKQLIVDLSHSSRLYRWTYGATNMARIFFLKILSLEGFIVWGEKNEQPLEFWIKEVWVVWSQWDSSFVCFTWNRKNGYETKLNDGNLFSQCCPAGCFVACPLLMSWQF